MTSPSAMSSGTGRVVMPASRHSVGSTPVPMRRAIRTVATILVVTTCTACVSIKPYMVDRGRDAADIFTATVGTGAGIKARVGPFAQGVVLSRDYAGVHGGAFFRGFGRYGDENGLDAAFVLYGSESGNGSAASRARNKYYKAFHILVWCVRNSFT